MAGQIEKRGDRVWMVRVFVGRNAEGKRKYANRTVHGTKKDAEVVCNAMLRDRDLGGVVAPTRDSVSLHLEKWLETVAKNRVRARTYADYKGLVDRYLVPELGATPLARLDAAQVQGFYAGLSKRGLSAQTVRHVHAVLDNALTHAVRWRSINTNPCDHVDLPKVDRKEMHALSPAEAQKFMKKAEGTKWFPLFALLIDTGLRPSEALALRWSDVDLKTGVVTVSRTLAGNKGPRTFEEPKTARSKRSVPIASSTLALLKGLQGKTKRSGKDLIFANELGGPLELNNLGARHFKPILKEAGIPQTFRIYDLRHTCATLLLSAGTNPKIVSERLGHASITLTLDTYSHVLPTMQQSAADELQKLLYPSGKKKAGTL
jgi:integrase